MDEESSEEALELKERVRSIELLLNSPEIQQIQHAPSDLKHQLANDAQFVLRVLEDQWAFFEERIDDFSAGFHNVQKALIDEIKLDIDCFKKHRSTLRANLIIKNAEKLQNTVDWMKNVKFFESEKNDTTSIAITSSIELKKLLEKLVDRQHTEESTDIKDAMPKSLDFDWTTEETSSLSTQSYSDFNSFHADRYKIKKHFVFKGYTMEVKILNIINMNEFYVQNSFPKFVSDDDYFLKSIQLFYSREKFKPLVLVKPRRNFIAAFNSNGTWHRVRIIEILPKRETCKLFLIDAGRYEFAKLSEIIKLHLKFFEYRQISIRCGMADVAPLEENGFQFPARALNEFKMVAEDGAYKIKLVFTNKTIDDNENEVAFCIVYICGLDDGKEINFNSVMVNKKYAASTGESSEGLMVSGDPESDEKVQSQQKRRKRKEDKSMEKNEPTTRVPVKIIQVIGPQEFYVAIECRERAIEKLEQEINDTDQLNNNPMKVWKENEMCLAFISCKEAMGKSHRGMIKQKLDNDFYKVFLVDYAVHHTLSCESLSEIPGKFLSVLPRAVKAHLAKTIPPGNFTTWPLKSGEVFSELLCEYKSHSISVTDEADETGSLPVLLYGVNRTGNHDQYHNILMYMYQEGFCDVKFRIIDEKFDHQERLLNPYNLKFVNEITSASELCDQILKIRQEKPQVKAVEVERTTELCYGGYMNFTPKKINSWIPSNPLPIGQSYYGTPTHVDLDGIIFFQTSEQTELAKEMCRKITNLYGNHNINNARQEKVNLKPGDCVIALYLDEQFYRAKVIRQLIEKKNTYRIQFVDYGTLLSVHVANIYPLVVGENIPIQVHRFVLGNILPSSGFEWSEDELDFLQSRICDNLCNAKVLCDCPTDPDIKGIELSVETNSVWIQDLAEQAVRENKGRHCTADDTWPIAFKKVDEPEFITSEPKNENILQINATVQSVDVTMEVMKKFLTKGVESSSPNKPSYKRLVHRRPPTHKIPNKQNRKQKLIKKTKTFDLRLINCKEFECKLISIHDARDSTFYVEPLIPEIQDAFNALLAHFSDTPNAFFEPFKSISKAAKKSCLVSTLDDMWLRGEIIEIQNSSVATVFLVDLGITDTFDVELLRKMDMRSLKCPQKIVKVKLNVKSTEAASDHSINSEYLIEQFVDQKLKAIIKSYDDDIPVVDLIDNDGTIVHDY